MLGPGRLAPGTAARRGTPAPDRARAVAPRTESVERRGAPGNAPARAGNESAARVGLLGSARAPRPNRAHDRLRGDRLRPGPAPARQARAAPAEPLRGRKVGPPTRTDHRPGWRDVDRRRRGPAAATRRTHSEFHRVALQ